MEGSSSIVHAPAEEVAEWLKGAVDRLDTLVDEKTRIQIMETCGSNCAAVNRTHIEMALTKRQQFETLDEFLEAEEKNPMQGTKLVRKGSIVYQHYDPRSTFGQRCFCSLWRGIRDDETVSPTWCQCSKGFVMNLWEAYCGRPVKVELIESSISGATACTFAIHLEEGS
jgi:hypothetical protein